MTADAPARQRVGRFARAVALSPLTLWIAFVLVHLWLGLLNLYGPGQPLGDVTGVYKFWMDRATEDGFWVGIDSQWVYPIVALVPMVISLAAGSALYASTWLSMIMLLDAVAFGVLTGWGRSRLHLAAAWWWVAFLALLGPIALGRIDSVTVPLAVIGVLLIARRPRLAALLLTIATWIKVWPAAIIAAVVIATKQRLRVLTTVVITSIAIVAVALLLGSGSNVFSFVSQQNDRGLQIESPVSTIWLWMTAAGVPGTQVYYDRAILTFQVEGPGSIVAAQLMNPLFALVALAVCAVAILAVRRGATATELLAPLSMAVVTAFIVFNKVGSPQYETWLAVPVILGLVTFERGGRSFRFAAILSLVIAAITQAIYPTFYDYLLVVNPTMLIAITARNLLLIVLFGWAVARVVRLARWATIHEAFDDEAWEEPKNWPLGRADVESKEAKA